MTRIKKAGPPVVVISVIAGIVGYILGCTNAAREEKSRANAQEELSANEEVVTQNDQPATGNGDSDAPTAEKAPEVSPVKARLPRDTYYPNTEDLAPDEMRVIACGTGMPTTRAAQAAACFLVELGNGDKFLFDIRLSEFRRCKFLTTVSTKFSSATCTPITLAVCMICL